MPARPTHDLSIKTGEYTDRQTGEQKARWLRIGSVFRHDDGSTSIKLDCLPLGLPDWNGWVNVFPREERREADLSSRSVTPPRPAPRPPRHEADWSDDVPFARPAALDGLVFPYDDAWFGNGPINPY